MRPSDLVPEPASRSLRIFAFDPALSAQFETAGIGEITIEIPWEKDLQPGPVGEYIEVVDADPASGVAYKPVDLNDPRILARDGLAPSESNPQFHQQMVYAVAMTTIGHFEQALGRVALWSSHHGSEGDEQFVRRLRVYPHALRDRNAYYSPQKKALLFGYFPVGIKDASNTPGTLVFSCLSHDIIAHGRPARCSMASIPASTSRSTRTSWRSTRLSPTSSRCSSTSRIRASSATRLPAREATWPAKRTCSPSSPSNSAGRPAGAGPCGTRWEAWKRRRGDGSLTSRMSGRWTRRGRPTRGAILVAAVFGAFLKVYRARTADLYRIASEGTGVLREGDIHPDLANRLAAEAAHGAADLADVHPRHRLLPAGRDHLRRDPAAS